MDDLERSGCATLLSLLSLAIFVVGFVAVMVLFVNDEPSGGIASLAPPIATFIGSFICLAISIALTIYAAFFRKRALWMFTIQVPASVFFAWIWMQM
ncbi:hypothetical protein [Roseimaritima multifibrata]|uniref:hypothetical protein n=1 Tax=Roseimaritima multifibrata TaxID=1930274 RepID=UPI0011AA616A|nr:hypothetical protein [Roseimaritima multifibrata]